MRLKNKKILITFIIIFFIALIPRIIGLGRVGVLADEERWINRGSEYVTEIFRGNFSKASRDFERHPGIPAAILIGSSVLLFSDGGEDIYKYESPPPWKYSLKIMPPLTAARLPIAILGTFSASILFFFVWRIWKNYPLALISGLFLSLDIFHISLSRTAHQDVALCLFFMLTVFTYYLGEKEKNNKLKILAGVFWGLAFLTKIVAVIIPVIFFIWKIIEAFGRKEKLPEIIRKKLPINLADITAFLIGFIMFFVFYTRTWPNPIGEFLDHLLLNFEKRNLKDLYFYFGYVGNNPSITFYITHIFIRLSEIAVISLIVGVISGIYNILKTKKTSSITVLLVTASLLTWLALSITGKMKDRYIMPIWAFVLVLAASGFVFLLKNFFGKKHWKNKKLRYSLIALIFVISFGWQIIYFYPYYFLYYNKFIGNIQNAKKITLVSRGEGMMEAAEYLNQKEGAENLKAVPTYGDSFSPYFKGKRERLRDDDWAEGKPMPNIDYIVFFVRGVQKKEFGSLYQRFVVKDTPEKIITLKGLDVAYIYKVKKD